MRRVTTAVLGAAAIAGVLFIVRLAWLPASALFGHFVIEDTGYYLAAARNFVAGRGVTLDGVNVTNGFHPSWFLVLSLLQWLIGTADRDLALHATITICAVCFIATGWLIVRDVRRVEPSLFVPMSALIFCNYRLVSIPLGGLESALAGLSVIVVALAANRDAAIGTARAAAGFGLLLGFAYLARLDALLLGAVVLGWIVLNAWRHGDWRRVRLAVLSGVVSAATLLPWFAFSWRAVHAWLPRSGDAILQWSPSPWSTPWTTARLGHAFRDTIVNPAGFVANVLGVWPLVNTPGIARLSGALALAAALVAVLFLAWKHRRHERIHRLGWIPIYAFLHTTYYLQFSANPRYLYPVILLLIYAAGIAVATDLESRAKDSWPFTIAPIAATVLLVSTSAAGYQAYWRGFGAEYTQGMVATLYDDVAPWMNTHTPGSARIGTFNGGVLTYFSGRTVVNLDGVMNDNAIHAIAENRLCTYIDEQRLDYLVDNDEAIAMFLGRDRSCGQLDWRARWTTIHQFRWTSAGREQTATWVVMTRVGQ